MSALTITNPIPQTMVVLSAETLDRIEQIAHRATFQAVEDEESLRAADALYRELHALEKEIDTERARLKRPVIDLGKALDEAAKPAIAGLTACRSALGDRIAAFQAAENARRAEARRKAEEEARKAQAEALAAAEAKREAERAEAKLRAELEALPDEPAPVIEDPVFEAPPTVPTIVAAPTPPPLKTAVVQRTVKRLVIDDPKAIPVEISGVRLLVPDERAIGQLMRAGIAIPGCRLVEEVATAAKGRL